MEATKHQNITSADKTSIGFDYQYLYFIYRALELKPGEKIGYEVKDDVHLELNDGKEVFIQLKHSIQTNADNNTINMTEKDGDLWKTLYNWNISINEINPDKRSDYIKDKEFILVTNKNNNQNKFFIKTTELKNGMIDITKYREYILGLKNSITGKSKSSENLINYMDCIYNQSDEILIQFTSKLNITFGFDDLVIKIKNQILSNHIDERKLEEIFQLCIGNLSIWKYEEIKKGQKVFISFDEIDKRIKHCFIYGRSDKLPRASKRQVVLPEKLEEQNFIKELIDIDDIEADDKISIAKYTTFRLKIENLLQTWIEENYITESQKNYFLNECKDIWCNIHKKAHRQSKRAISKGRIKDEELNELLEDNSLNCLDYIREVIVKLCDDQLSVGESNGTFYSLSENEEIGWKFDWEKVYKNG